MKGDQTRSYTCAVSSRPRFQARTLMVEAQKGRKTTLRDIIQRIRVPAGFLLIPLLLFVARPTALSMIVGSIVAVIGLVIRAWASGCLKKNRELTTWGPYAFTRNPLYLGTFIMGVGVAIGSGVVWFAALFMTVYLLIYLPVMFAEADYMSELFAEQYAEYRRAVPLFAPRLTPYRASSLDKSGIKETSRGTNRFQPSLYLRHREYNATLGVVAVFAFFIARYLWR